MNCSKGRTRTTSGCGGDSWRDLVKCDSGACASQVCSAFRRLGCNLACIHDSLLSGTFTPSSVTRRIVIISIALKDGISRLSGLESSNLSAEHYMDSDIQSAAIIVPIDVCEAIIDYCASHWYDAPRGYEFWLATSQVCRAWHPRSRANLLYEVRLSREAHVDLLRRTLDENPMLSDLIYRISLQSPTYIPLSHLPPRLYRTCKALDFDRVYWTGRYPAGYFHSVIRQFSGLVELSLDTYGLAVSSVLRFVWSLPALRSLTLTGHSFNFKISSSEWLCSDSLIRSLDQTSNYGVCPNLTWLDISVSGI